MILIDDLTAVNVPKMTFKQRTTAPIVPKFGLYREPMMAVTGDKLRSKFVHRDGILPLYILHNHLGEYPVLYYFKKEQGLVNKIDLTYTDDKTPYPDEYKTLVRKNVKKNDLLRYIFAPDFYKRHRDLFREFQYSPSKKLYLKLKLINITDYIKNIPRSEKVVNGDVADSVYIGQGAAGILYNGISIALLRVQGWAIAICREFNDAGARKEDTLCLFYEDSINVSELVKYIFNQYVLAS